jgi:predicted butyrate kinase (DUF1464 family)
VVRVAGIDPGTLSLDCCRLDDGRLVAEGSWSTADLAAEPAPLLELLLRDGPLDLVVGPSGYGLPLRRAAEVSDEEFRLAFLAPPGEAGGIGGLRGLTRHLVAAGVPLVFTPGVVHLGSVPVHRKLNRVDLGTADKVAAAALAIADQGRRLGRPPEAVSLVLLELGGAFTAGVAVERGQIVAGVGGTSGPIGWRASGALDGEVAFLAGTIAKSRLFEGGVETILRARPELRATAVDAFVEGAAGMAWQLGRAAPEADEIMVSGRLADDAALLARVTDAIGGSAAVRRLDGFSATVKQGAQGAAVLADGLAGGAHRRLVERLGIREANGTVLDHLHVISSAAARRRLGLPDV